MNPVIINQLEQYVRKQASEAAAVRLRAINSRGLIHDCWCLLLSTVCELGQRAKPDVRSKLELLPNSMIYDSQNGVLLVLFSQLLNISPPSHSLLHCQAERTCQAELV